MYFHDIKKEQAELDKVQVIEGQEGTESGNDTTTGIETSQADSPKIESDLADVLAAIAKIEDKDKLRTIADLCNSMIFA